MADETPSLSSERGFVAASIDGAGLLEGDTFVTVNEKLTTIYGFDDADALVGTAWTDRYPAAERERIETEVLPCVRDGRGWRGEARGIRADGTTFAHVLSIQRSGSDGYVWVVRERDGGTADTDGLSPGRVDIQRANEHHPSFSNRVEEGNTREKRGAGSRRRNRDDSALEVRLIAETAPVPVVVLTADRGIVYSNQEAVELLGADECADIVGEEPEQFVHPDQRDQVNERIRRVVEHREATEPTEYRLVGLDDTERFAEIATAPVTYEGDPAAYVVVNDVTSYRRSQARLRREQRFIETVIDAIDDVVYVLDEAGETYLWNQTLVETTGYSHEEIAEMHNKEFLPEDQHEYAPGLREAIDAIEDRRVELDFLTKDDERIPHEFKGTTFEDPVTGEVFRCGIARDITERLERERALERQRDELATFDRINRILLETTRDLIQTASRDVVERTVCTQLSDSDLYEFAWISERLVDGDHFVPRTVAGKDRGFFDAIADELDGDGAERTPVDQAIQSGDVQVVSCSGPTSSPWQEVACECGFESIAVVPLQHDGTIYGTLVIHTLREDAFNDREQDGFDVLGRTVGYIINAVRNRKLLFADTVTELEFRMADADSDIANLADALDCALELDGYVASDQQWILYWEVDGAPVDDVVATATDDAGIERARDVSVAGGGGRVELTVTDSSLIDTVTRASGVLRTASVSPDGTRFVVETTPDADIREIVDYVQNEHPSVDFVAQRDRDHEVSTGGRPDGILGGLTDRQREALEAAYRSGYFTWPRASTAEEVAESLGLSSPTLHGHLRKAEATILSELFDGTRPDPDDG